MPWGFVGLPTWHGFKWRRGDKFVHGVEGLQGKRSEGEPVSCVVFKIGGKSGLRETECRFERLAQMVLEGFVLGVYKIWELAVLPLVLHFGTLALRPHLLPILYHYHQALTDTLTLPDHIAPSLGIPPPLAISVPTSSPPSSLLPSASHREDRPEVTLPPRKRLGIALGPGYEVGESSSAAAARPAGGLRVDYGFVATMDREIRRDPEREVGMGINRLMGRDFETPMQWATFSTDTG
ncbi:hypothetical protein Tco_1235115 [Tanacetum coccineum]